MRKMKFETCIKKAEHNFKEMYKGVPAPWGEAKSECELWGVNFKCPAKNKGYFGVLEQLAKNKIMKKAQIMDALELPHNWYSNTFNRLIEAGFIQRIKIGVYKIMSLGESYVYAANNELF